MKATLATLACLLTVGFLSAASVEGNNTAVVIRKNVVKSDTGWQFLCVPVNALNIDGSPDGTIELSTLLPPATLTNGTLVRIKDAQGDNWVTYEAQGGKWVADGVEVKVDLTGGEVFWVKDPTGSNPLIPLSALLMATTGENGSGGSERTTGNETIIFCGQDRTRVAPDRNDDSVVEAGLMNELKNDSSVAITLNEAATCTGGIRPDDMILTIQKGSAEYKKYFCRGGVWKEKVGTRYVEVDSDKKVIAPGEAFYYYKAATTNN